MSEFWLCFNCCIAEQPQPKRRRRIDRSMIGEPTNFWNEFGEFNSKPNAVQRRLWRRHECKCSNAACRYKGRITGTSFQSLQISILCSCVPLLYALVTASCAHDKTS
ncbi:CRIB domain-containing protein [Crotalus adamanteus]|uniref:CRIB domain-containing protein n=1 Tax=Crotalus adamanteus TaxID=8729 RepID=A0AAW1C231_CROAD